MASHPAIERKTLSITSAHSLSGQRDDNRSMTMNKEKIYDDQISPLMQQIIAISREHGIAASR
jgi:hypothetical protein